MLRLGCLARASKLGRPARLPFEKLIHTEIPCNKKWKYIQSSHTVASETACQTLFKKQNFNDNKIERSHKWKPNCIKVYRQSWSTTLAWTLWLVIATNPMLIKASLIWAASCCRSSSFSVKPFTSITGVSPFQLRIWNFLFTQTTDITQWLFLSNCFHVVYVMISLC